VSGIAIGGLGFAAMLALLVVRIPIGVSMSIVGMVGYAVLTGGVWPLFSFLKHEMFFRFSSFDLSVIPLFVLMGQFAAKAGMSQALFRAANAYLGHFRGGIAMAAIGGCAGFGAIAGSSLATAATMGNVALPELRRYNYSGALATGTLAAGGTLGILIPPSVPLIIYAVLVEGSIAQLFQAAFVPGLLAALGYVLAIALYVRFKPDSGPAGPRASAAVRLAAILDIWPVLAIFVLVMGGIYGGYFTPNEGASIGAAGTFLLAITRGHMRLDGFIDALISTGMTSALIFLILFGAGVFNAFLGFSQMPLKAAQAIQESGLAPMVLLVILVFVYILLGMVMDSLSMILLTVPIFWPIISSLDYGMPVDDVRLWFGVISLIVIEVGLITPPVGLNVFIINSMAKDVPMLQTFRGVVPFLISDATRVGLVMLFPMISLYLPHAMR
jgi:tripartite ATP-independent transporter DctM subunit